jgi:DNA polymerase III epsilon subunit-like protein
MATPKLLVIDTETGGFDPEKHSILTLGAVVWADGAIAAEMELLIIETPIIVDPGALKVNHIDILQHVQDSRAVPPAQAIANLQSFLDEHSGGSPAHKTFQMAGHNIIDFDLGFLRRLCRLAAVKYDDVFPRRVHDTMIIARFLTLANKLPLTGAKLKEVCDYYHIEYVPHHALSDARATAKLLAKLMDEVSGR